MSYNDWSRNTGLRICKNDKPVPLKSVDISVDIKGFIANVTAVLVYKNPKKDEIEVRYQFPMDDGSAVYRFEAEVEGRVIIAECQEKKMAQQAYEEAVKSGHTAAFMAETFASDVFSIKVGNIPPDSEVKITFSYVIELGLCAESGVAQFTLCTVLNPRYNPDMSSQTDGSYGSGFMHSVSTTSQSRSIWSKFKSTFVKKHPYNFSFKAKVVNSAPISKIKSVKDDLKVDYNADKTEAQVSLGKPFVADHDLTLDISYSELFKPHAIIEKGVATEEGLLKEDLLMLNFCPQLSVDDRCTDHEFIIIIDRSGSMGGARIKSAAETLLLFLKSLPSGCYFNIVGFGSHYDRLFLDGSKELSDESLATAMKYYSQLDADFGGTEILQPLKDIFSKPPMNTHTRQLFVLTDGKVENTNEVINLVYRNANKARVFSFGIGEGASTALVNGIARAGRGRAEFIKEGDRLQPIVMKTLKAAMQLGGVTDLQLEWDLKDSPKMIQIPKVLPPLFSGDRLIVYALSVGQPILEGRVYLTGRIGHKKPNFCLDIHSGLVKSSEDRILPLHRLAAKSQIQQLQDEETHERQLLLLHNDDDCLESRVEENLGEKNNAEENQGEEKKNEENKDNSEKNKAAIILLSTAANIISRYTAMVAIDKEKSAKITGHKAVQNVYSPHHVNHYECQMLRSANLNSLSVESCDVEDDEDDYCSAPGGGGIHDRYESVNEYACDRKESLDFSKDSHTRSRKVATSALQPKAPVKIQLVPGLMGLVQLQTFSGFWKLNSDLEIVLEINLQKLKSTQPQEISDEVWATLLALAVLNMKYSENKDEWEMIENKAGQWLKTQQSQHMYNHSFSSLQDLAKAAVSN